MVGFCLVLTAYASMNFLLIALVEYVGRRSLISLRTLVSAIWASSEFPLIFQAKLRHAQIVALVGRSTCQCGRTWPVHPITICGHRPIPWGDIQWGTCVHSLSGRQYYGPSPHTVISLRQWHPCVSRPSCPCTPSLVLSSPGWPSSLKLQLSFTGGVWCGHPGDPSIVLSAWWCLPRTASVFELRSSACIWKHRILCDVKFQCSTWQADWYITWICILIFVWSDIYSRSTNVILALIFTWGSITWFWNDVHRSMQSKYYKSLKYCFVHTPKVLLSFEPSNSGTLGTSWIILAADCPFLEPLMERVQVPEYAGCWPPQYPRCIPGCFWSPVRSFSIWMMFLNRWSFALLEGSLQGEV